MMWPRVAEMCNWDLAWISSLGSPIWFFNLIFPTACLQTEPCSPCRNIPHVSTDNLERREIPSHCGLLLFWLCHRITERFGLGGTLKILHPQSSCPCPELDAAAGGTAPLFSPRWLKLKPQSRRSLDKGPDWELRAWMVFWDGFGVSNTLWKMEQSLSLFYRLKITVFINVWAESSWVKKLFRCSIRRN